MPDLQHFASHSAYSDPGPYGSLLAALPLDVELLSTVSRNVIGHYRAELADLPEDRRSEIDSRWLDVILKVDQQRHRRPLTDERPAADRVAGCCRDHALVVVAALRHQQVPARTRVGFAHYLVPNWAADHVIAEYWQEGRWRRVDPELSGPGTGFDGADMPTGPESPFETAAQAWSRYRNRTCDLKSYGVFPGSDLSGPDFVRSYVFFEVAHRYGDELLLWDSWGATRGEGPGLDDLADHVASLLLAADNGDDTAEADLAAFYHADTRLHPFHEVTTYSPYGSPSRTTRLRATASSK